MVDLHVVSEGWKRDLGELLTNSSKRLVIATPYVTHDGVQFLSAHMAPSMRQQGELLLLTDLSPVPICQGSTDPAAILALYETSAYVSIYHLPRLHSKVYVSDCGQAIITSGNLTRGGLDLNFEHGTRIRDREVVDRVRDDIQKLTLLGSFVSREAMASYTVVTEEARRIYQLEYHRLRRNVSKALGTALDQAERTLLRLRLKEGAMHTIFADAILYLLDRYGPLQTPEVHQFVQRIYPDLCDDTVDRVIDGWHYGKRWKHAVRTAQQHLKRRGLVDYRDARWQLSSIPHRT